MVIHELMVHAASHDAREDFVELRNLGPGAVDLAGWRLSGDVEFTFPPAELWRVPAGGFVVVAADRARFVAVHPGLASVAGEFAGRLSNTGNELELRDSSGAVVDRVRFAQDGDWATRERGPEDFGHRGWVDRAPHDGGGSSLELVQPGLERNTGQNWAASVVTNGTPGAPNSTAATNLAPLILEVRHTPAVPTPIDPVVIRARVVDEAGPGAAGVTVRLYSRLDGEATFQAIAMGDAGTDGDGRAGDGEFGAVLPVRPAGSIVEFYLEAIDSGGRVRTWPAPALDDGVPRQVLNALYQVEDLPRSGSLPEYRLILAAADRAELLQINRNQPAAPYPTSQQTRSHARFHGTFVSREGGREEVRYGVLVRNRGNGSRSRSPQSFRVDFGADRRWNGVLGLNLNTQYPDTQRLGSAVFRQAGLAAGESRPVQLRVNGLDHAPATAPSFGFVVANEVLDADFVERQFPLDAGGNLYRAQRLDGVSHAALDDRGSDPEPYRTNYFKRTNGAEDDWSDLIELCRVASAPTGAVYEAELARVADVAQWVRYFAVNAIANNRETSPVNGDGDDYFLYRGVRDPRFLLLPYDLDTVFGAGDSTPRPTEDIYLLVGRNVPAFAGFLTHATIAPRYYAEVLAQCRGAFAPGRFDPFVDHVLGGVATAARRDAIKAFNAARVAFLLQTIPRSLSVTSSLPTGPGGYRYTSDPADATVALGGRADAVGTRTVLVNGQRAEWVAWQARWSAPAVAVVPGFNRIEVRSLDETGELLERVWYDVVRPASGGETTVSGTLAGEVRWTRGASPFRIGGTVTVPAGASLVIEPGVTVLAEAGAGLRIRGRLMAEGTATERIRFTRPPSDTNRTNSWAGLIWESAEGTNRLGHVDFEFGGSGGRTLDVTDSVLEMEGCTFAGTTRTLIETHDSSLAIRRCVFPSLEGNEHIHGADIPPGGFLVIEGNVFGTTTGLNDIIDFSRARRPGPVLQVLDNVFTGASDDVLDLDGCDAHIEGNLFLDVTNGDSAAPDTSSAISFGQDGGYGPRVVAVRNRFVRVDHIALCKEGGHLTLENNTAIQVKIAAVNFSEPLRGTLPGAGARLAGNLIVDCPATFENLHPDNGIVVVETSRNLLPAADLPSGGGGDFAALDPLFVATNLAGLDACALAVALDLLPGSPGRGAAPLGIDVGAAVPPGAVADGLPFGTTWRREFEVVLGGPGMTEVRWRLDGAAWSAPLAPGTRVPLVDLSTGDHRFEVVGLNSAALWQEEAAATSYRFTVTPAAARLVIHEILAVNRSHPLAGEQATDWIELHNDGPTALDLGGYRLSDDPDRPGRFVFPAGTRIDAEGFLVVAATADAVPGFLSTGFGLAAEGDRVVLSGRAGEPLDRVEFGPQVADVSIGRDAEDRWVLTRPTPGSANRRAAFAPPTALRINEWLARSRFGGLGEFVEIYNPRVVPVLLDGVSLTDNAIGDPRRSSFGPLSFIDAGAVLALAADGRETAGHVTFRLAGESGSISLIGPDGILIDGVFHGAQTDDVAEGRRPDGGPVIGFLPQPTPGAPNPGSREEIRIVLETTPLIALTHSWRYDESGRDLGTSWREPDFDDREWPVGGALFHHETASLPAPKITPIALGPTTYYFRTRFAFAGSTNGLALELRHVVDDGAVFWLNGRELGRFNMPTGLVSYATEARSSVSDADLEGPETYGAGDLVVGENVLAVEVHQSGRNSTDAVFGLALEAVRLVTNVVQLTVPVVINELRARGLSGQPDYIELFNPGPETVDLSGCSLTDDVTMPRKYVIPEGRTIPSREFRVWNAGGSPTPGFDDIGFGFAAEGGGVFLFARPEQGGGLLDGLRYGNQLATHSLGRVPDGAGHWTLTMPTPQAANQPAGLGSPASLRINEWMADPESGDDWFELFNPDSLPVAVGGFFLTDDLADPRRSLVPDLTFVGTGGDGFWRVTADGSGDRPGRAAFRLGRGGDTVALLAPGGGVVDVVRFGAQVRGVSEGRFPDGAGATVSFPGTGSAGLANYRPIAGLVVNELLAHTDPPLEDAVEFANLGDEEWNLEGWYLSDDPTDLRKVRLSGGPRVAPGGLAVVYEAQWGAAGLGTSPAFTWNAAHGGTLWLSEADATGRLTGYRLRQDFEPTANGISLGRVVDSAGREDLVPLVARTFGVDLPATLEEFRRGTGRPNAAPRVGPVVIGEVHYHPVSEGAPGYALENPFEEFVELCNLGLQPVPLFDPAHVTNGWALDGAIGFRFPPATQIPARGAVVVVAFDPVRDPAWAATFRTRLGVPPGVAIFGPFDGRLRNEGDDVVLRRPDAPQAPPHPDAGWVPQLLVERIRYLPTSPWPAAAAGGGASLHRLRLDAYANDPANWQAAAPNPGRWDDAAPSGDADLDGLPDAWEREHGLRADSAEGIDGPDGDPDGDGMANRDEYRAGTSPRDASSLLRLAIFAAGAAVELEFLRPAARRCELQAREDWEGAPWIPVQVWEPATAAVLTRVPVDAADGRTRFYRLAVAPSAP